jgi:DnaK suppressor protein
MARTTAQTGTTTPAEKTAGTRAPVAKPARKTPRKSARKTAEKPARKPAPKPAADAAGRTTARSLAVKPDEKRWTAAELAEVQDDLVADRDRLRSELNLAEHELHDLMRDAGDGAGNDQADVGSTTFERDHEMSLANNARDMLAQTEHALQRIADGTFGVCESCAEPVGKMRLMAFPRATLCLSCKQREERR